jgi:4-oxalocrotonate tautomerase
MPILNVKVSAQRSQEMTKSISRILLDLTSRILHKDPGVTSIAIEYINPEDWVVAGKSLVEHGKSSIYFDIKITDETNTKAEKAQYIKEAFDAFADLLGDLHNESYIYVQDVRATSYGFGGKTQEYRFHRA